MNDISSDEAISFGFGFAVGILCGVAGTFALFMLLHVR
jgi:hypothetical protein